VAPDKASHSSLTAVNGDRQKLERFADGTVRVRSLIGMTTEPIGSLLPLARSWNSVPQVESVSDGFESHGYDAYERVYGFRRKAGTEDPLEFTISANPDAPLVHLPLVIRDWGDRPAKVELVEPSSAPEGECRIGRISRLDGTDLVLWIPVTSSSRLRVLVR
jgi:hypothetical protein